MSGVRAILRRGDAVLTFDEPGGSHILPGGRIEVGESFIAALCRELREETGCSVVGDPRYIGFLRLHHLTPRQESYRYPYPDFLQLIYVAVTRDEPVADEKDEWVVRPRFVPLKQVDGLNVSEAERAFLRAL